MLKLQVSAVSLFFTTKISKTELRLNISFLNNQIFHLSANMTSFNLFLSDQMIVLKIMISESINAAMKTVIESIQSVIDETINNMQLQKNSQLLLTWNVQTLWKSLEIKIFYFNMFISWECKDIIDKENKIYYKSVTVFMNKFKIITLTRNAIKICQNFDICLCKKTEKWWINKLDELVHVKLIAYYNNVK